VELAGVTPTNIQATTSGRSLALTARVMPAGPSILVTLTVSRFDPARRVWVTTAVLKKGSSPGGTAAFAWRPTTKGSYRLRLTTPSTSTFANGLSATYRWTVS
jgi:hypothetical protein